MEELTIMELVRAKYSGGLSEMAMYLNFVIQTGAVLIGGIILWRASNIIHKKRKAQRVKNAYFETSYAKEWKRKQ